MNITNVYIMCMCGAWFIIRAEDKSIVNKVGIESADDLINKVNRGFFRVLNPECFARNSQFSF